MIKGPKVEERAEQPTLGIRTQVPMSELPKVIPELTGQVFAWMGKNGVEPAGAPFIKPGVLPAGRYATLVYIGDYAGLGTNPRCPRATRSERATSRISRTR